MRKHYTERRLGTKEKYWDANWAQSSIEEAIRFCEFSPLRISFEKYFPKPGKILEGGCGLGLNVIYYTRLGYDIQGVDFAARTINRILKYDPSMKVKVSDVTKLDYPDNYFDVYYSGGVVEHFEGGPLPALREAHRVLKPDGILILTVPYMNMLRKLEDLFLSIQGKAGKEYETDGKRSGYILANEHKIEPSPFRDLAFFEYMYEKKEIMNIVRKAGFDVLFHKGVFIMWGLMDVAFFKWLYDRIEFYRRRSREKKTLLQEKTPSSSEGGIFSWKRWMKRLIVEEDERIIMFKPLLSVLQRISANLILLGCKTKKGKWES